METELKKIKIFYWHEPFTPMREEIGFEHEDEFEYTVEKRNEIIDAVLKVGWHIMTYIDRGNLIIAIDDHYFHHR